MRNERVGFFGGTFDPPHRGHLEVAKAAADRFRLDRVLLAPVGIQPLKTQAPMASYAERLHMTELLCREDARLSASGLDEPKASGEPNYTVDTLLRLRGELQEATAVYVIVGADAFLGIRRWKDPERLLALADWIVVSRPGFGIDGLSVLGLGTRELARVHAIVDFDMPISATALRRRLREKEPCNDWLTPSVSDYILRHHLYSGARSRYDGV